MAGIKDVPDEEWRSDAEKAARWFAEEHWRAVCAGKDCSGACPLWLVARVIWGVPYRLKLRGS